LTRGLAVGVAVIFAGASVSARAEVGAPADMGVRDDMLAADMRTADLLAPPRDAASANVSRGAHAGSPVAAALDDFDFGNYESVVQQLRPIVENGATELRVQADREEVLRDYGIACALTNRQTAAEGAFLLLLRAQPGAHLDAALVRPEAVALFEAVRARHREELLAAYRKGRPRYFMFLNVLPLVGQIQNRQWRELIGFGASEVLLLSGTATTAGLLYRFQGNDHTFSGHQSAYKPLQTLNVVGFSLLLAVTVSGIIDAFVVGARRRTHEHRQEQQLGF
jgi:hypothetical protein